MPVGRRRTAGAVCAAVLASVLLGVAACTAELNDPQVTATPTPEPTPTPTPTPTPATAQVRTPPAAATVLPAATPYDAALEVSRTLFASAPVVVVAPVEDPAAQLTAATLAVELGVPALLAMTEVSSVAVTDELVRLGAETVVMVGVPFLVVPAGAVAVTLAADADPAEVTSLPATRPPTPPPGTVALTGVGADNPVALATIRAAGVPVVDTPGGDPRATTAGVQALAAADPDHVIALGAAFGAPEQLAARTAVARTGVLVGGGGQLVFPQVPGLPGKRYVALYGAPGTPALGVLGEQDVPSTIARAAATAAPYVPLTPDTVVPAVEVIATIASGNAEPDGTYSRKGSVDQLRPLVEAAGAAGMAVVLDLQPGRQDFVTQAQLYADLLALPYVGLALDPEWRLAPDQVHLRQIGSVGVDEVNATIRWLADFTAERHLPQKMLVLHQFANRMIVDRTRLDTSRDELAIVIHVDGQGAQPDKAATWNAIRTDAPPAHWGWKNFYDEDAPMLDPTQTYQVQPVPDLVTYQ